MLRSERRHQPEFGKVDAWKARIDPNAGITPEFGKIDAWKASIDLDGGVTRRSVIYAKPRAGAMAHGQNECAGVPATAEAGLATCSAFSFSAPVRID
jgi:hypothetical protein